MNYIQLSAKINLIQELEKVPMKLLQTKSFYRIKNIFDTVNYENSIQTLGQHNVHNNVVCWFKYYLTDRKQYAQGGQG